MANSQIHRLRRLSIKSNVFTSEQGFALRSLLSGNLDLLDKTLNEACETLPLNSDDTFYQIPKLVVDVKIANDDLKDKTTLFSIIQTQLQEQIQKALLPLNPIKTTRSHPPIKNKRNNDEFNEKSKIGIVEDSAQAISSSVGKNAIETLLHYLNYGILPWHVLPSDGLDEAKNQLIAQPKLRMKLNKKVVSLHARRRWVAFLLNAFTEQDKVFESLLNHELTGKNRDIELCEALIKSPLKLEYKIQVLVLLTSVNLPSLPQKLTAQLLRQLTQCFQELPNDYYGYENTSLAKTITKMMSHLGGVDLASENADESNKLTATKTSNISDTMSDTTSTHAENSDQDDLILRINYAGLVLFHPYLPRLFSRQKWLDKKRKINTEYRTLAAKALAYLCSAEPTMPEHQAVIIKLLLGMKIDDVLVLDEQALDSALVIELDDLTTSFISHWRAIGNTSSTGLRSSFIQRQGILKFSNDAWQMTVERNAPDVLLESLPFSISTIRLPWMPHPLHLTW